LERRLAYLAYEKTEAVKTLDTELMLMLLLADKAIIEWDKHAGMRC